MIGLDTNVLVRYFAQDDAAQFRRAKHLIETQLTAGSPGYLCSAVIVELVWVLERTYDTPRDLVARILDGVLSSAVLRVEHKAAARRALASYLAGTADYADGLIACLHQDAGCNATLTFDRKAARLAEFELLTA